MNSINAIEIYNNEMRKPMLDKIFFLDKIGDAQHIFDFGCGDGSVINFMQELFPNSTFFGYDENREMIDIGKRTTPCLTENMEKFFAWADSIKEPKVLVFNSVMHEIFSYKNPTWIMELFNSIAKVNFDYIVIRDMHYDGCERFPKSDNDYLADVTNLFRFGDKQKILEFENNVPQNYSYSINDFNHPINGSGPQISRNVTKPKDLHHFLLKYRYVENWERECGENYFAFDGYKRIGFQSFFKDYNYNCIMEENFIPLFIQEDVKKNFKIEMNHNTHIKLILKRN